jgi:hypothetical protein
VSRKWRQLGRAAAGLAALGVVWSLTFGPDRSTVVAQQDDWTTDYARRIGVRLLEARSPSGTPAYPVAAGDLLFFTNTGTSYGSKSPKNAVVVINARTLKPIAVSDLEPAWSEGWTSHGIGVSPDARYVYLPAIPPPAVSWSSTRERCGSSRS